MGLEIGKQPDLPRYQGPKNLRGSMNGSVVLLVSRHFALISVFFFDLQAHERYS